MIVFVDLLASNKMNADHELSEYTASGLRPVHLLRVVLLRVLESNFRETPYKIQRTWEFPPLRIKSLLDSNPLKSKLLVGGLGVWSLDSSGSARLLARAQKPASVISLSTAVRKDFVYVWLFLTLLLLSLYLFIVWFCTAVRKGGMGSVPSEREQSEIHPI